MLPPLGPSLVVEVVHFHVAGVEGVVEARLAAGDDVVEVHAASPGSRIPVGLEPGGNDAGVAWSRVTGVGDDVVGVDAERGPEVCAISVIRQRAETENSAFANIDDTVEDAQADIASGVQRAASRVDITLDNAIGDRTPLRP